MLKRLESISIHALREEGDPGIWSVLMEDENFYPRPPRGGRHGYGRNGGDNGIFLSTPSARRATIGDVLGRKNGQFLSTPSARRATKHIIDTLCPQLISIHALREEGDWRRKWKYGYDGIFLSTPSARRATNRPLRVGSGDQISIHALREEGD